MGTLRAERPIASARPWRAVRGSIEPTDAEMPGVRVLVADDDADTRRLLCAVLDAAGYDVSAVNDGTELHDVLVMSPAGRFRVVVTDHLMPSMRGLEVLARTSARAHFVVLSGAPTPEVEGAAGRLGASAFLRKPVDLHELLFAVADAALEDTRPEGRRYRRGP
jgi:CheY-like chemotaxis protein